MGAARKQSFRAGFSLIEALFSLVILAAVSAGVFTLFSSNYFGAILNPDRHQTMLETQAALRSMGNDCRSGTGFTMPANPGGGIGVRVTLLNGQAIEYYRDGNTLKRQLSTPGSVATTTAG